MATARAPITQRYIHEHRTACLPQCQKSPKQHESYRKAASAKLLSCVNCCCTSCLLSSGTLDSPLSMSTAICSPSAGIIKFQPQSIHADVHVSADTTLQHLNRQRLPGPCQVAVSAHLSHEASHNSRAKDICVHALSVF